MAFEDIFSKKTAKNKDTCPNPSIKIIIDTREKQSLIAANLLEKKANISFEKLEVGDYQIQDTLIERKTFSDFINSMTSKRLQGQLIDLRKSPTPLLILEGKSNNYSKISSNALRGMIVSITTSFKIPIIQTKDENDTSKYLISIAKKYEKKSNTYSARLSKTAKTENEQKKFILEGFPGIGPVLAKSLIEKFKTLDKIFSAKKDELMCVKGFDEQKINNFLSLLKN